MDVKLVVARTRLDLHVFAKPLPPAVPCGGSDVLARMDEEEVRRRLLVHVHHPALADALRRVDAVDLARQLSFEGWTASMKREHIARLLEAARKARLPFLVGPAGVPVLWFGRVAAAATWWCQQFGWFTAASRRTDIWTPWATALNALEKELQELDHTTPSTPWGALETWWARAGAVSQLQEECLEREQQARVVEQTFTALQNLGGA